MLYELPFLFVVLTATSVYCEPKNSSDYDEKELQWPEKYSFEITKYDITGSLIEDIKVWKTDDESRIEYNDGAVKSYVTKGKGRKSRGYKYELHPETYGEDQLNQIICARTKRSKFDSGPDEVLPDSDDFEFVGEERMAGQDCDKFYKVTNEENKQTRETVWAFYDEAAEAAVPVRYEKEEFNSWIGNIDVHEIWDFENFDDKFNEKKTFDVGKICDNSRRAPIDHKIHDEAITKHLKFIDPDNKEHVDHVFKEFKNNFNRNYAHKDEHAMRKSIFQRNLRMIKSRNRQNLPYKLAVNQFTDRTPKEMLRHKGLLRRPEGKKGLEFPYGTKELEEVSKTLPKEYDLRLEGIISPVVNQESCGSCWTFGTTAAVEGALARYNGGNLIRLSNQALIDCAWEFGASGCNGGSDNAAYEWVQKYGLPKVSDYGSYENEDGFCHIANVSETYRIRAFVDVTPNSVEALKAALIAHGPLSVSVHASDAFVAYSGGVFYDFECSSEALDHEVSLVGYGEQYGETFWILKNSWGQDWGIDGFMHIAAKDNNCGVMTEPTYVLIKQ